MPDKARELVQGLKAMGFTVVLLTNAQQELAEGACKDLGAGKDSLSDLSSNRITFALSNIYFIAFSGNPVFHRAIAAVIASFNVI